MESNYVFYDAIYKTKLKNSILDNKGVYIKIENGIILPGNNNLGGVCDKNGEFINECKYSGDCEKNGGYYKFSMNDVVVDDQKVLYLGFFLKHWGHFLMDCLARTWILENPQFDNYKIVFLYRQYKTANNSIDGNYLQLLKLIGVEENRIIEVKEPTMFSEIIIPSCGTDDQYGFSKDYTKIFKTIIENSIYENINVPSHIYLSRMKYKYAKKKERGEKDIEENFKRNGYAILCPEELSLNEQIAIFQKADEIVCVNGTIPLNVVFAHKHLKLVVLNKMSVPHINLIKMCSIAEISPVYIDVYREPIKGHPKDLGIGPFWLEFNENLKKYFEDNNLNYKEGKKHFLGMYIWYYYSFIYIKIENILKSTVKKILFWFRRQKI